MPKTKNRITRCHMEIKHESNGKPTQRYEYREPQDIYSPKICYFPNRYLDLMCWGCNIYMECRCHLRVEWNKKEPDGGRTQGIVKKSATFQGGK